MKDGMHKVGRYFVEVKNGYVVSGSWESYDGSVKCKGTPKRMVKRSKKCPLRFRWEEDMTMSLGSFRARVNRGTATIF